MKAWQSVLAKHWRTLCLTEFGTAWQSPSQMVWQFG